MTDVQEVPWTTAPELVEDALDVLDISDDSETAERARRWAQRYDVDEPISAAPSSVAAGSIYLAAMFERARVVTQDDLRDALGVQPQTVTRTYREIAAEEGITFIRRSQDEPDPSTRSLVRKLLQWLGRVLS